jgi:hypothetical protein
MKSLLQGLQQALPKPCLFGLYGALGGLVGALFLGAPLWFVLSPARAEGAKAPPLQLAASESVSVYQSGNNRFTVKIARSGFEGPVTVRATDLPTGITARAVTIPDDKDEAEVEVRAAVDAVAQTNTIKVEARGAADEASGPSATGETKLTVLLLPPALRISLSPEVEVVQGGKNRFRVKVARDRFEGPVDIEPKDSLPKGVTIAPVQLPPDKDEIEIDVAVARKTKPELKKITLMGYGPDRATLRDEDTLRVKVKEWAPAPVDVLFVLDVTGSMGWAITGVRDGINDFVARLGEKLDSRIGLIAYRDHKSEREEPEVLKFDGKLFTKNTAAFQAEVAKLRATGGGDEPESTLDAITLAAAQAFRPKAHKVLLVITDATPHIPDRDTKSIEEAVLVLNKHKIDQLHFAVHLDHWNRFYKQFSERPAGQKGEAVPGKWFDLRKTTTTKTAFADTLMPGLGKAITEAVLAARPSDLEPAGAPPAPRTRSVAAIKQSAAPPSIQSIGSTVAYAKGSGPRLVLTFGVWSGVIAAGVCLALIAGQYFYLRQALLRLLAVSTGLAGGLFAGLVGGALGESLSLLAQTILQIEHDAPVGALFRILGWALLGSLAGLGLSFFVPNLRIHKGLLGGAIGGTAGAAGFITVTLLLPDWMARLLGATLLGACIGVMVALVERAFRTTWLEVRYGKEVRTVNLGPEPVSIGSSSRDCTIYARNAPPVAFRYWARNGKITRQDATTEQLVEMKPGESHAVGVLIVAVRAAGAGAELPAAVLPVAVVAQPTPAVDRPVRLSPSIGQRGAGPPPRPAAPPGQAVPVAQPAPPAPVGQLPVAIPAAPPRPPMQAVPPRPPTPPAQPSPFAQPTVASPVAPPGRPATPPAPPTPRPPTAATTPAQAAAACPHCGYKAPPGEPGKRFCMVCEKRF